MSQVVTLSHDAGRRWSLEMMTAGDGTDRAFPQENFGATQRDGRARRRLAWAAVALALALIPFDGTEVHQCKLCPTLWIR